MGHGAPSRPCHSKIGPGCLARRALGKKSGGNEGPLDEELSTTLLKFVSVVLLFHLFPPVRLRGWLTMGQSFKLGDYQGRGHF